MNLPLKQEYAQVHHYLLSLSSSWDGHQRNNTEVLAYSKVFSISYSKANGCI